jgi:uncharacterized membrane protein YphA (DoxX/SURF4 family)
MRLLLLCLRIAIGWQCLYEGIVKLLVPDWSAAPFLLLSQGPFSPFFHWLGSSPHLLRAVDLMNIWGLILIGSVLILGVLTRIASASGIVLLALYYLAQPPLIRTDYRIPIEGHYLLINTQIIEILTLTIFLFVPTNALWGLDRLVRGWLALRLKSKNTGLAQSGRPLTRRTMLADLVGLPIIGVLGYSTHKKQKWEQLHAITGATIKLQDLGLKDLKGELPKGNLGHLKMSRIILGNNLIGGWAHSRDLIYVSELFKAYNTDRKVFETFDLAQRAGIDTVFCVNGQMPLFNKYFEVSSTRMQTICQVFPTPTDLTTDIDKAIDLGVTTLYVQGHAAEVFVKSGQLDLLGKALEHIKAQGYLAGIGGHSIQVPIQCEKAGLNPDYYVKTLHSDNYWSATPRQNRVEFSVDSGNSPDHDKFHDNMFDLFPEQTIDFMASVKKPWIAFKVMAAGAFEPKDGFRFAFENGADFICAGIFDFQMVEDVNVAIDVLSSLNNRKRPWYS